MDGWMDGRFKLPPIHFFSLYIHNFYYFPECTTCVDFFFFLQIFNCKLQNSFFFHSHSTSCGVCPIQLKIPLILLNLTQPWLQFTLSSPDLLYVHAHLTKSQENNIPSFQYESLNIYLSLLAESWGHVGISVTLPDSADTVIYC